MTDVAYIALGSNLGDRHAYLAEARAALAALPRSLVVGESSIPDEDAHKEKRRFGQVGPGMDEFQLSQMANAFPSRVMTGT